MGAFKKSKVNKSRSRSKSPAPTIQKNDSCNKIQKKDERHRIPSNSSDSIDSAETGKLISRQVEISRKKSSSLGCCANIVLYVSIVSACMVVVGHILNFLDEENKQVENSIDCTCNFFAFGCSTECDLEIHVRSVEFWSWDWTYLNKEHIYEFLLHLLFHMIFEMIMKIGNGISKYGNPVLSDKLEEFLSRKETSVFRNLVVNKLRVTSLNDLYNMILINHGTLEQKDDMKRLRVELTKEFLSSNNLNVLIDDNIKNLDLRCMYYDVKDSVSIENLKRNNFHNEEKVDEFNLKLLRNALLGKFFSLEQ